MKTRDTQKQKTSTIAWQGWRLEVPSRWSPLKLEGDYNKGHALFADLHRPRLGVRWQRPRGRRFDPADWTRRAMREEVGMLAAEEAAEHPMRQGKWAASRLYLEPDPPGRDVWQAYSEQSGRTIQLIYHARRRERILAETLLPTLADLPVDEPTPWSIFELSCIAPPEMRLEDYRLNAGDLSLSFTNRRQDLTVRQVAVAELALQRLPLEKWMAQQQSTRRRHYRPYGPVREVEVTADVGRRVMSGISQEMLRRRRFIWMRWMPERFTTLALHDQVRDRLVIVQGNNETMVDKAARSVGWAT